MKLFSIYSRIVTLVMFALFLLLLASGRADAQQADMAVVAIKSPSVKVEINLPIPVVVTIRNNGPQQNQAFACQFQIVNSDNGSIKFTGTIAGRAMTVNETADFTSTANWLPDSLGNYRVLVNINAQNDPTPTNNQSSATFIVVPISRARAITLLRDNVITPNPRKDSIEAYHVHSPRFPLDSLLHPDESITTFADSFVITTTGPTYLFFVDEYPNELFTHPCRIVTVSGLTGAVADSAARAWPIINDQAATWGPRCGPNPDRVQGNALACKAKTNPYAAVPTANTQDWALATSGVARNDVEESVIDQDICRWKERMNGTASGPHVSSTNIDVQRGQSNRGLTKKEFCDIIDSYKGKACSKFLWKHIGHGSEEGLVFWDDAHKKEVILSYHDIACKFDAAGIREVCIEITACHSGGITAELAKKNIKGVVITSSSKANTTPYEEDGTGTPWEKALDSCSKDPNANLNRDSHTDLCELYAWVKIKGSARVQNPNPQILKLGDSTKFVSARMDRVSVNGTSWGGSYIQRICVTLKVKKGTREVDSVYYSYTLYIDNLSDKNVTDTKTYKLVVTCDAPGGKKTKITLLDDFRPNLAPHEKICLTTIPPDCKNPRHSFEEIKKKKGIARKDDAPSVLSAANDTLRGAILTDDFGVHSPGKFLFYRYILTDTNNAANYTTVISAPASWTAYVMPDNFFVPKNDSADIFFGATVPDTATQGTRLVTTITNKTTGDTTIYRLNVLLPDTISGTIGLPFNARYVDISASGNLSPSGTSQIENCYIDVADSFRLNTAQSTAFTMRGTILNADSGRTLGCVLAGPNVLTDVTMRNPVNGVAVTGTALSLSAKTLTVAGSQGNGFTLTGVPPALPVLEYLTVINARQDALSFSGTGATPIVLYGAVADLSGGNDLALTNGAHVDCVDCMYDENKAVTDNTSVLRRYATLGIAVNDTAGTPLMGAAVTVKDASGAVVFRGSTDNLGFVPQRQLLVSTRTGSAYVNNGPFSITVRTSQQQADTTYSPVAYRQIVFWMKGGAVGVHDTRRSVSAGYYLSDVAATQGGTVSVLPHPDAGAISRLEVWDILGDRVWELKNGQPTSSVVVPLRGLPPGTYFVRITLRDGTLQTLPFVVR